MTKETLNKIHNMLCSIEAALITDPVHNKGQVIDCISLIKGAIEAECTAPQPTLQPTALDLISAEREKQIRKGYTVEHDAAYVQRTGISYSLLADRLLYNGDLPDDWNMDYWIKLRNLPNNRKLAIAGAWIAAELDRMIYLENLKS